jgi:two-component system cell cycle response regulator DivK
VSRILLVDDYVDALEMWALYLRQRGYSVVTARDGLQAVEIASAEVPDLIVLDLDLPGISGFEAARRLRELPLTAHIPLIAATGYGYMRQLESAGRNFAAILVKPCEPAILVREIERALTHPSQSAGTPS